MSENQEELVSIPFITEDGEKVDMYVLEETTVQGIHYILVTDDLSQDSEEAIVTILKENGQNTDEEYSIYHPVESEEELTSIAKIFAELMDDVDFEV
mgnify:CR=1 FL=1